MNDEAAIEGWRGQFEEWVEYAKPLLPAGKAA